MSIAINFFRLNYENNYFAEYLYHPTNAFSNSFIPMTSRNWNSLPMSVFSATYDLQSFKTRSHRHLQLRPNPGNLFLFSRYKDPPRTTEVVPFWCDFFFI